MSNAAKLKKKAVEFEQKKQYDKALALYVQILDAGAAGNTEPEVGLYNRVGDLLLRTGNADAAIGYYRKAVDLYAESGFLNNAIALCNKILRQDPSQTVVHYRLGRISAQKGFKGDAKVHFLEYAQRMQRAGDMDESFRALKEFADLCPDQDDIRLMLAEQLSKQGRSAEAAEQLQTLHEKLTADGRTAEARATAERLAAIDPAAAPRTGASPAAPKDPAGGLVFLDVSWEEQSPDESGRAAARSDAVPAHDHGVPPAAVAGLETTRLDIEPASEPAATALDARPAPHGDFALRDPAPLPGLVASAPAPAGDFPDLLPALDAAAFGADAPEAGDSAGPELTYIMPDAIASPPARAGVHTPAAGAASPELDLLPLPPLPPAPARGADAAVGNDAPSDAFVNLGDWLRDDEGPKSTRMVVDAVEPGEGEEFDFDDMLRKFKRGVAENVDEDDHESHYDLGIAFREMGLLDEAISEFQKALRGSTNRVRTFEALGQCFVDKGQHQVAASVLGRAVSDSPADDQLLVGVLYLLGAANEGLGRAGQAIAFYQRVFAVDINFRDVGDRLSALERTTR